MYPIRLLAIIFAVAASTACFHIAAPTPISPTELAQRGTQRYSNVTREQLTSACAAALETLGYRVAIVQPERGIVKTAPRTFSTSLTGSDSYANVTEAGLAWQISVEASGKDAVVHAAPRAFRNGSEMHDDGIWSVEAVDPKFRDLWHELDDTLNDPASARALAPKS